MKIFILILSFLLIGIETSQCSTPLTEEQRERIETQRDQMIAQLESNMVDATKQVNTLKAQLASDATVQSDLTKKSQTQANTIASQATQITALKKSLVLWKRIVAGVAALAALLACLWLNVPKLATPYGILITIAAPLIVFGLVMLL